MSIPEKVLEKVTEALEAVVTVRSEAQTTRENVRDHEARVDRRLQAFEARVDGQLREFDSRLREIETRIAELRGLVSSVFGDAVKASVFDQMLKNMEVRKQLMDAELSQGDQGANGAGAE